MWYNRLNEYLLKEGYANNPICPYIFIKKPETGFAIIVVYVDHDLNLIGTPEELTRTTKYLKNEFEIKDLGKIKFYLGLQIEHFPTGVLIHQSAYTKKILKGFYMDKAHPLSSPMIVCSLDMKMIHFFLVKRVKNYLVPKYHILVSLVHLCILLTILAQVLFFLSIY